MKFQTISFAVIFLFSLIGLLFSMNAIHELSHVQDFKPIVKEGNLCLFNIPTNHSTIFSWSATGGYYKYTYNKSDESTYQSINKWSETKAYVIEFIPLFIFVGCLIYLVIQFYSSV